MKLPILLTLPVLVLCACAHKDDTTPQNASHAPSETGSYSADRLHEIAQQLLSTGQAHDMDEAESMAQAQLNEEWAKEARDAAEQKRQAKMQETLRNTKLSDEDKK